jgi:hypothetical protein
MVSTVSLTERAPEVRRRAREIARPDLRETRCSSSLRLRLDSIKPVQPLGQLVRGEFEMNYPAWLGIDTRRGRVKQ